ncbi:MAG: tail fiber domain-containing protein, partial [Chlorobi bacterium]|nr:tail fiber domain-containing protein [Chlorobiota bacterium]
SNTTGYENSAFGIQALYTNTEGYLNSAFGYVSLFSNTTGSNNIGIGYSAQVPSGTSDNQVRIGNTAVTYAGIQVAWTITSDRRWKQNILPSKLGLGFISRLNPVSYTRINDESQKTEYGFIGQEVDSLLKDYKVDNPGMITITDEGNYELRYNDLLAPMVKAIQELNEENQNLKIKNQNLEMRLAKLEQLILELSQVKEVKSVEK